MRYWDDFDLFEEIIGQKKLSLSGVLVEKLIEGKTGVKLVVRGNQEKAKDMKRNSQTINKVNSKLIFLVAANKGGNVKMCEVRSIGL